MSEPPPSSPLTAAVASAEVVRPPLQLVRLGVDKPQAAVAFLHARSRGVMDLIAHFWERLAHTPPLQRGDLHLIVATPLDADNTASNININIPQLDAARFSGAMLYVPKAHRADVLALDPPTAAAFAAYISHQGPKFLKTEPNDVPQTVITAGNAATLPLTDLSARHGGGGGGDQTEMPAGPPSAAEAKANAKNNGPIPIDFLTGDAEGIAWMTPLLLPLVHKRVPARELVNVVMQLPSAGTCAPDPHVRIARDADIPALNRWRRQYKEERGILFDADMDALVEYQRVFVLEMDKQVVAVAKIDIELHTLVEIGGVYTFPEFRKQGYGAGIVSDLAYRIRQLGKIPTLQVDEQNTPALQLYAKAGWQPLGKLARVWLTG